MQELIRVYLPNTQYYDYEFTQEEIDD